MPTDLLHLCYCCDAHSLELQLLQFSIDLAVGVTVEILCIVDYYPQVVHFVLLLYFIHHLHSLDYSQTVHPEEHYTTF